MQALLACGVGVLGTCPSHGSLKVGAVNEESKHFTDREKLGLHGIGLQWRLWPECVSAFPTHLVQYFFFFFHLPHV